ncbi:lamin tail domain-containing protein [Sorangium sp. So ce131]|uniref:lamin tail domain-containing protein n=1 Tax=Sorangium sp. So ce131 TaxID=3133282 RepID=UPI003F6227BE
MNHRLLTRPSWTTRARRALLLALAPLVAHPLACAPELAAPPPVEAGDGDLDDAVDEASVELQIEPPAPLDAAPPVLRLRVHLPAVSAEDVDLARVLVIRGKIGAAHVRQLEQGEPSKALSERVVPSLAWLQEAPPGDLWLTVAPLAPLVPGETYAVAGGSPSFSHHIQIAAQGATPVLPRIWPPADLGASLTLGIWCGDVVLPEKEAAVTLAPDGPAGELRRGAVDDLGARCLRFEAESPTHPTASPADGRHLVGPPAAFPGEPDAVSLDPRPFVLESEPLHAAAAVCEAGEVPLGPGCAQVADDRIHVRSAEVPLLWAIAGEGLDEVVAVPPGERFVLAPLPPLAPVALDVATVDNAGRVARQTFSAVTLAPMPHVVINEVLSNPRGAEPSQEWVELYNDGDVPAELGRYVLADVGGETELPSTLLEPGAYALVVNEVYAPEDELDPSPCPEALLLRVPKLGNHGLSNTGEPLKLKDGGGAVVSRSPALPEPKAGMSLARVEPRAPDGSPGSFVTTWPTPGCVNIMSQEIP